MIGDDSAGAMGFRRRMVQRLVDEDEVPPAWAEVLEAVPRHLFVPDTVWHPTARGYLPLCRGDDPGSWLGLAYRDERIVAQVDDGSPNGAGRYPTCSVLAPSEVAFLLSTVDIEPGMRVCVVGAGLGYLTAVLAHRLGAGAVCAVEVDPGLAQDCRRRLDTVGLHDVDLLVGDGTTQLPAREFDLLVCTATVQRVPGVWLRRVRPGGMVVTGFGTTYHQEALLRLDVHHADLATGRVVGELECEWERGQRVWPVLTVAEVEAACSGAATTTLDVEHVAGSFDVSFAVGARVPNCASVFLACDDQWWVDPATGSWSRWHRLPIGRHRVDQYGPRALWDEIDAAYRWWCTAGRPRAGDWRVTVDRNGTVLDLPTPAVAAAG